MSPLPPGYTLREGYPSVASYLHLRAASGLSPRNEPQAAASIAGSWYGCYITYADKDTADEVAIGMGRIVGDGGWYFHIADMAVLPDHQRKGLGDVILKNLLDRIRSVAPGVKGLKDGLVDADDERFLPYVNLMADEPGRKLYLRNGFDYSAPRSLGMVLNWEDVLGGDV
ncbi:hypothetical protein EYZ11_009028 [Aspergillus tanneri]|uniref:N-acetyltransferase domain-containing protein n=1 Tax=Aspergillus tanneri TaxID=1220188 RepID=A0A4S3J945_9EURO|nr:uncharacterized protein ATNIH1004_002595 [Aspergillus tanneri]KAA8649916.1 hypothetical protein ATNIH1004_002595 [Aspergillus tanneri]THC91520.1 hypothetical protein EYZ11_009028 [Aspergillus tanneri]